MEMQQEIDRLALLIRRSMKVVVFTGAGVSTESGIPDFRSPGGVWDRFNPSDFTYQKFVSSEETRRLAWRMSRDFYRTIVSSIPNPAHLAIVELERMGKLSSVITQNIDGLHHISGNSPDKIIELHGTVHHVICLSCGKSYPRSDIQQWLEEGVEVPYCERCEGILKQATISFGQAMPVKEMTEAEGVSRRCDLFIVVGSSLVVQPAAMMPLYAKESGAKLAIVNLTSTPHDRYADLVIRGKAGEVMSQAMERVRNGVAADEDPGALS